MFGSVSGRRLSASWRAWAAESVRLSALVGALVSSVFVVGCDVAEQGSALPE